MSKGHRERLRKQFIQDPGVMTDSQILELILTYAIPRKDVRSLAESMVNRYGSLKNVLKQSTCELFSIDGLGEYSASLLKTIAYVSQENDESGSKNTKNSKITEKKTSLLSEQGLEDTAENEKNHQKLPQKTLKKKSSNRKFRAYIRDLVDIAFSLLPEASHFTDLISFRDYLFEHIPINSQSTRRRYAQYLLNRFFPEEVLSQDLVKCASILRGKQSLREIIFYLTVSNELLVERIASEVIWPSLPLGRISKLQVLEGVENRLQVSTSTIKDVVKAIFRTYQGLRIAGGDEKELHIRQREGDLDALVFILHREFSTPGMYDLQSCLDGPLHTWLLYSQDWIKSSIYRLRERGILSKVSEIDNVRQFSTIFTPEEAISKWYQDSEEGPI